MSRDTADDDSLLSMLSQRLDTARLVMQHIPSGIGPGQLLWLNRMMQALVVHCLATWRQETASVSFQRSGSSLASRLNIVSSRLYNADDGVVVRLNCP